MTIQRLSCKSNVEWSIRHAKSYSARRIADRRPAKWLEDAAVGVVGWPASALVCRSCLERC